MEQTGKTALIIVDMQNDFCEPDGSLAVKGSLEIIPLINKLRESKNFDMIVTTRDWHAQNHVSFCSNHKDEKLFSLITVPETGRKQVMWPDHCVQGSKGSEYHPDIVIKETDTEVLKGQEKMVESYSGFGSEHENTGMTELLKKAGVTKTYSCGLAYDYCVGSTAESAANEGFDSYIIIDATRSVNEAETGKLMKERLLKAGVKDAKCDDFL